MRQSITVELDDTFLSGDRWVGDGPPVVLLHSGVDDRRSWQEVAELLSPAASVVTYDRRGHGETPPPRRSFSHVGDLLGLLDEIVGAPAWLVGSSFGGGVALEAALVAPEHVAGLVLLAPAVPGAPDPDVHADPAAQALAELIDAAEERKDLDELNRLEAWFWLDGPGQPEGRVQGPARQRFFEMHATVLAAQADGAASFEQPRAEVWQRLSEIEVPATVACGELDAGFLVERSAALATRLAFGAYRMLPGVAHLPQLEDAGETAGTIADAAGLDAAPLR